jgi:mannose-6-phosphate isomerase-like protein (cupin superfamily)
MPLFATDIIDLNQLTQNAPHSYQNTALTEVNNHVVRMGVMTEDYFWHYHPNSDETFMVIEGTLLLDLENETIELSKGQMITVPQNISHRTRPKGVRSINLTIELTDMETVRIDTK